MTNDAKKPSDKAMRVARWALNTGYRYGVYPNPRKTIDDYIEEIARRLDEEYPQDNKGDKRGCEIVRWALNTGYRKAMRMAKCEHWDGIRCNYPGEECIFQKLADSLKEA